VVPRLQRVRYRATGGGLLQSRAGTNYICAEGFNGAALDTTKWLNINGTVYPDGPAEFGTGEVNRTGLRTRLSLMAF
jgi:hypothetical protein